MTSSDVAYPTPGDSDQMATGNDNWRPPRLGGPVSDSDSDGSRAGASGVLTLMRKKWV